MSIQRRRAPLLRCLLVVLSVVLLVGCDEDGSDPTGPEPPSGTPPAGTPPSGNPPSGDPPDTGPAAIAEIRIDPVFLDLIVGDEERLTATPVDSAGVELSDREIAWSSSDAAVAAIDAEGMVSAASPGIVTISAASEGVTGSIEATIRRRPVADILIEPGSLSLLTGDVRMLTATPVDSEGNEVADAGIHWTASDPATAAVSPVGLVTAGAPGTAQVVATSGEVSVAVEVEVRARPVYTGGSTIIIRVVGTSPDWGQEPRRSWPDSAPVKNAPGYRLYDLEIGRDASFTPTYVSLFRFDGWDSSLLAYGTDQELADYFDSRRLSYETIGGSSGAVLAAVQRAIDEVLAREDPGRLVISYAGHGGPSVFFEGTMTMDDGRQLIRSVRDRVPDIPLILDFSTNCFVGFFDFARYFYDSADYLIASERAVGGFMPGDIDEWLQHRHDTNLHRFFAPENSMEQALDEIMAARQQVWEISRAGILESAAEQSLAVYDLAYFNAFINQLAATDGFAPEAVENDVDLGAIVYQIGEPDLVEAFEAFRIRYASNRDMLTWTRDTWGFSLLNAFTLVDFLSNR